MANLADYPNFNDGDVQITAPSGNTWKLHSSYLSNASPHFRKLLADHVAIHLTKKEKADGKTIKWLIRMNVEPFKRESVDFRVVDPSARARPEIIFENVNGLGVHNPYVKIYDNFFKCVYNMDPKFDTTNQESLTRDCIDLLTAAEDIDSIPAVRRFVESSLLRLGGAIYDTVRSRPEPWCVFGIRLQSPAIFREAMVHIVGAWELSEIINQDKVNRSNYSGQILDLVNKKIEFLNAKKQEIDQKLLEYYPAHMMHPITGGQTPNRTVYANDIYFWQALTVFRQWVTGEITDDKSWRALDGGFDFYKKLHLGNDQYLTREDLAEFHEAFPMSPKGRECLQNALFHIKEEVRDIVSELFVCNSQGHEDAKDFDYFTCVSIGDKELPWYERSGEDTPDPDEETGDDTIIEGEDDEEVEEV